MFSLPSATRSRAFGACPLDHLAEAWTATVDDYATALATSHDGTLLAVGTATGQLFVFDTASGALRFRTLAHAHGVLSLNWSPRQRVLATGGQDGRAQLLDEAGRVLSELSSDTGGVQHVSWAPDGRHLATACGTIARIWNASAEPVWRTDPHASPVTGLAWNRRGTELATACVGGVQLFRIASPSRARRLPWRGALISLAWSPTDAVIACGTDEHSVHFWRVASGQDSEIYGFPSKPLALSWDASGKMLATGGDVSVSVWVFDAGGPEGRPPIRLAGHQALCTALAFHPREACLASGGDDMSVLLWKPTQATTPIACGFLEDTLTGLCWTAQGNLLIGADAVGTVRAWHVK
jgi:WD40 repeat protein